MSQVSGLAYNRGLLHQSVRAFEQVRHTCDMIRFHTCDLLLVIIYSARIYSALYIVCAFEQVRHMCDFIRDMTRDMIFALE